MRYFTISHSTYQKSENCWAAKSVNVPRPNVPQMISYVFHYLKI